MAGAMNIFTLRHSKLEKTNRFYSIVDESHTAWTKKVMDKMLSGKTQNHLDTGWTLEAKSKKKLDIKKEVSKTDSSVTPPHKSISDSSRQWAVLDLNQ